MSSLGVAVHNALLDCCLVDLLQSNLSAEQSHSAELATEVTELESRVEALEGQLAASSSEAADYIAKYGNAKSEAAQLARQLEEVGA